MCVVCQIFLASGIAVLDFSGTRTDYFNFNVELMFKRNAFLMLIGAPILLLAIEPSAMATPNVEKEAAKAASAKPTPASAPNFTVNH